jgi:hypothetical protein
MMKKPAFLVEGHLEKKFVQKACPNAVVRLLQCNGDNAALTAIAKRIVTHCRLLRGRIHPLIVVLDREDRRQTATEISDELLALVRQDGVKDDLIVAVSDRNIENWILADIQTVIELHPCAQTCWTRSPDGFNGKSRLKKTIKYYHETTTGVDLLLKCRANIMRCSPSFDYFFKRIDHLECWWLQR